jgi:hypothetical protein
MADGGIGGRKKIFFFEKKKQKTFPTLSRTYPRSPAQVVKVFWFFFSKKNRLMAALSLHRRRLAGKP